MATEKQLKYWNSLKGKPSGVLGKHHTEEVKRKLSEKNRGNKNGRGNKGKKHSTEAIKKISIGMTGKQNSLGWKQTEDHKKLISKGNKGKKRTELEKKRIGEMNKGIKRTDEFKQKLRERNINNPNRIFKDTSIELKVEAELQKRNINYQKQVPLCKVALVDFYLPEYRIVIQCDGCY